MRTQKIGQHTENIACRYLQRQGLSLITRNFRSRFGEIDLVMRDQQALAFVEVRYRNACAFGTPLESITREKQRKLQQTGVYFLRCYPYYATLSPRFDVIGLTGDNCSLDAWVKHAFDCDDF